MEILAIIPARGGSKGIPHKNIVNLCGKPLIQYTIDAAKGSKFITRTLISTDDEEIALVGKNFGVEIAVRPEELARDKTTMLEVVDYHLEKLSIVGYKPEYFVILQPTSPLRTSQHIDEAIQGMLSDSMANSVVSVIELPHLFTPIKIMQKDDYGYLHFYMNEGEKNTIRQTLPKFYARNGAAIYAVNTDIYLSTHSLYGTYCIPYLMEQRCSIDIDEPYDLCLAEYLINNESCFLGK